MTFLERAIKLMEKGVKYRNLAPVHQIALERDWNNQRAEEIREETKDETNQRLWQVCGYVQKVGVQTVVDEASGRLMGYRYDNGGVPVEV